MVLQQILNNKKLQKTADSFFFIVVSCFVTRMFDHVWLLVYLNTKQSAYSFQWTWESYNQVFRTLELFFIIFNLKNKEQGRRRQKKLLSRGLIGDSDPRSCLLFCQIPVSCLLYVYKQFSFFFVISRVPLDFISRFHATIIWLSHLTLTKNRQSRVALRPQWDPLSSSPDSLNKTISSQAFHSCVLSQTPSPSLILDLYMNISIIWIITFLKDKHS